MGRLRIFNVALVVVMMFALIACTGGAGSVQGTQLGQQNANGNAPESPAGLGPGGFPGFPGDSRPEHLAQPHRTSAGSVVIRGTDTRYAAGGQNNYSEPSLSAYVIVPGGNGDLMAYAVYAIGGLASERPVSLEAHVTAAPISPGEPEDLPLSYYIGVGDYTSLAWQWKGVFSTDANIDLNEFVLDVVDIRDRYVSASAVMYIAVATAARTEYTGPNNPLGLSAARIETLTIHTGNVDSASYFDTRPHYASIESINNGGGKGASALDPTQYVTLCWTHVFDLEDPSDEAVQYKLYRKGPMNENTIPIGSVNAPTDQYSDPTDNSPGIPEVIPGATYTYSLRAYNPSGYTPFDHRDYTIPLFAPTEVTASDRVYGDKIVLTWTKAYSATGYKIYRDGQEEADVIAVVGDVATYDDTGVSDFTADTYRLRSTNEYMLDGGEWSDPATGNRASDPEVTLTADPMSGDTPLTVNLDASGSYDPDDGSAPGIGIADYQWDWDADGTYDYDSGTDGTVSHVFTQGGQIEVAVRVEDNEGATATENVTVNINWRPIVRANAVPLNEGFPLAVDFDASTSIDLDGTITKYEFDFGDGGGWFDNGTNSTTQHTYDVEQVYTAYVRVTDDQGVAGLSGPLVMNNRGDWWMVGHDRQHTHRSPFVGAQANNVKWSFATGGVPYGPCSAAMAADGTVYIGGKDGKLYAISPGGTLEWSFTTGDEVRSSPAVGFDGTIYAGSCDGNLYAVYQDGTLKWAYTAGGPVESSPAIDTDETVYVGSRDNNLYAINPNGTLKWAYATGGSVESSPAIGSDGTVYVGSDDENLYAINADGTLKWLYSTNGEILWSSPAIGVDGTVYVGSEAWNFECGFCAINPDGTLKWQAFMQGQVLSSPAIGSDGTIYVMNLATTLYAMNADGTEKWHFWPGSYGPETSSPAVGADGTVYVGGDNLRAINPDGTLKWSAGGGVGSSPAIGADGTVYVGCANEVHAFGP